MKIKKISAFLFFFSFCFTLLAQDEFTYTVIGMKGSVTSKKAGREFQTGDVVSREDELTFKNPEDMVGLIRNDGKRFIYGNRKERRNVKVNSEDAIMLGKTRFEWKNITIKSLEELQQHLSEAPFIFLDSVAKIRMDQKTFPQNGRQYFYFNFLWKNPKGKTERIDKNGIASGINEGFRRYRNTLGIWNDRVAFARVFNERWEISSSSMDEDFNS